MVMVLINPLHFIVTNLYIARRSVMARLYLNSNATNLYIACL